jgi:hypothetical protein
MAKLESIAKVIRSKNAGPFFVTLDMLFDNEETFERVRRSDEITPAKMAALYGQPIENVQVHAHREARAIKVTFVRATSAGSIFDTDLYGAQQHVLLFPIEIP